MLVSGQSAHPVDDAYAEPVAQQAPGFVDDEESVPSDDGRACTQCGHAHDPTLNVAGTGVGFLFADDVHGARAQQGEPVGHAQPFAAVFEPVDESEHAGVHGLSFQHGRDFFDERVDTVRVRQPVLVCLVGDSYGFAGAVGSVFEPVADDGGECEVAVSCRVASACDLAEHFHTGLHDVVFHGPGNAAYGVEDAFRVGRVESDEHAAHGFDERAEVG